MSGYFTYPAKPALRTKNASEEIRQQFAALDAAFNMLPEPAGGGDQGFIGGRWEDPTITRAIMTACNLGDNANPSFGTVAYMVFRSYTYATPSAGNRMWQRQLNGDLRVLCGDHPTQPELLKIDQAGNVVIGAGTVALATTATSRFLYIPKVAGVATGVPAAAATYTGSVPFLYDSTNNKIGVYNGSWRWTAALT